MAISKPTFSHRVYWKSQEEYEMVRARAAFLGLSTNISAYVRDCVVADMRNHGWNPDNWGQRPQPVPPSSQTQEQQRLVPFEGKMIPKDELPIDFDLSVKEEEFGSLAERIGLFDNNDDGTDAIEESDDKDQEE